MSTTDLLENKKAVPRKFNRVAKNYDFATFLSQGYQADLNLSAERMKLKGNEYLADLCCGTGKSTEACQKFIKDGKILAIDNSSEMLQVAKGKFVDTNVAFSQKDVMELNYPDNHFDAIFMAYGIRNMPDYDKCLSNLYRMLNHEGIICFHEYSINKSFFFRLYWRILGYLLIIPISTILSGSSEIYRYLVKSVLTFQSPSEFKQSLKKTGFSGVIRMNMPSWRKPILHTFLGHKK